MILFALIAFLIAYGLWDGDEPFLAILVALGGLSALGL